MMNFRYIIERMVSVAAMLLLALFVSCTEVGYMGDSVPDIEGVDNQEQSTMSVVDFEIAWPAGVASADIPDYVMVLMNRIQNTTVHYVFKLDGTGMVLDSFVAPADGDKEDGDKEDGDQTDDNPADGENGGAGNEGEGGDDTGNGNTDGDETDGDETGDSDDQTDDVENGGNGDTEPADAESGEQPEDDGQNPDNGDGESNGDEAGNGSDNGDDTDDGDQDNGDGDIEDGDGNDGTGDGETPGDADDNEGDTEEPEEEETGLKIFNGQYSVAALAAEDFRDFVIEDIERYGEIVSADYGMKDIYITIPQLTEDEKAEQSYIDFNPLYPYVRSVGEFWYVRPSNDTHKFISSMAGSDNTVRLVPQKLTRPIHFTINIDLEEGVIIKRCVGTISGVPQRVQLMTGAADEKNTGKMPFEMYPGTGNEYKGYVNAFGLFPSDDPGLIVGKGVFTIILHASVESEGVTSNRIFYASLPISDKILAAEIMKYDELNGYSFSGKDSYSIKVDKTLEVTREMVLSGASEGYEEWVRNEGDDDPDLNPGLNPES